MVRANSVRGVLRLAPVADLDLERAVLDVEVVFETTTQLIQHVLLLCARMDDDMRRHHAHAAGQVPDVKVMYIGHAICSHNMLLYVDYIHAPWHALQKYMDSLAH